MSYYTLQCDSDVPHGDFVKVVSNLPVVIDSSTETIFKPLPLIAAGMILNVVKYLTLKRTEFLAPTVYTIADPNCLGILEVHAQGITLVTDLTTVGTPVENRVRRTHVPPAWELEEPPVKPDLEVVKGPAGLPWLCVLERTGDISTMISVVHDLFALGPVLPNRTLSANDVALGVTAKSGCCRPKPLILWVPRGMELMMVESLQTSFSEILGAPKIKGSSHNRVLNLSSFDQEGIIVTSCVPTVSPGTDFGFVALRECKQFPLQGFFKSIQSCKPTWRVQRDGKRLTLRHGIWASARLIPKDIQVKERQLFADRRLKMFSDETHTLDIKTEGTVRFSDDTKVVITPRLLCLTLPDVTYTYTPFWNKVRICLSRGLHTNAEFLLDFSQAIKCCAGDEKSHPRPLIS